MSCPARQTRVLVIAPLCLVLLLYTGSYYYLSRRGDAEAQRYGMKGFLYVPLEEVLASEDLSTHYLLKTLYYPINVLDMELFNGPAPSGCIMFHLGGSKKPIGRLDKQRNDRGPS